MPKGFSEDDKRQIRAALLSAARQALPQTGFRRTSVEELCKAAGISKGAFYLFFESKEALCVAVLKEGEQRLRAEVRAELARSGPDRLERVLRVLFRASWQDPSLRALLDAEDLAWLTRGLPPAELEEARRDDDAFFAEVWQELRAAGDLGEVDATTFAGVPAVALVLAQNQALLGEERAEAVIALVAEGLALRLSAAAPATGARPSPRGT